MLTWDSAIAGGDLDLRAQPYCVVAAPTSADAALPLEVIEMPLIVDGLADDGAYQLNIADLVADENEFRVLRSAGACTIGVYLLRSASGQIDPALAGGEIVAHQLRGVHWTVNY